MGQGLAPLNVAKESEIMGASSGISGAVVG